MVQLLQEGLPEVLARDFARLAAALGRARQQQRAKDCPRNRAAVADCCTKIDAVLDIYLEVRAAAGVAVTPQLTALP